MGLDGIKIGLGKVILKPLVLKSFQTIEILATEMTVKEQAVIADSSMFSETPSKAETVIITHE